MKKALILLITAVFALTGAAYAVKVTEDNTYVIIKTDKYEAHWKKAAQMGYMEVFLPGKQNSLIGVGDRAFYHSSNYNGAWRDWGALSKWEIVDQKPGMAVVRYISHDSDSKEYTCTAYYYDSVNYIKHEVVVKNTGKGNVTSFQSGHDPQFEPNVNFDGMKQWDDPIPHCAYWTKDGFAALYTEDGKVELSAWGGKNPGRMMLSYDDLGVTLKPGQSSDPIVYWVAFGEGGEKEAHALASEVTKEPSSTAVEPTEKLPVIWGEIKR